MNKFGRYYNFHCNRVWHKVSISSTFNARIFLPLYISMSFWVHSVRPPVTWPSHPYPKNKTKKLWENVWRELDWGQWPETNFTLDIFSRLTDQQRKLNFGENYFYMQTLQFALLLNVIQGCPSRYALPNPFVTCDKQSSKCDV